MSKTKITCKICGNSLISYGEKVTCFCGNCTVEEDQKSCIVEGKIGTFKRETIKPHIRYSEIF